MLQNPRFEAVKEYNIVKASQKLDTFERKWGGLRKMLQ